ncbi:MAG: transposase [bacterium]
MDKDAQTISSPQDYVFLTLTTYRKRNVFINDPICEALCEAMTFHMKSGHVELAGFVIMPDHVHFLIRPRDWTISDFVNNFKTYTGIKVKSIGRFSRKVWRRRFYDIPMDSPADFRKKLDNMHNNPLAKKIAAKPHEYPWSSAANYFGWPGTVPVTIARF